MKYEKTNQYNELLGAAARKIRSGVPPASDNYLVREDTYDGTRFIEVWFRSKGCHLFLNGGCTMCNYGYSKIRSNDEQVSFVQSALSSVKITKNDRLLVSPSGSFLDDWEVNPEVRNRILDLVSEQDWCEFGFETQANFVSNQSLKAVKDKLGDRPVFVEIGIESADELVRRYSINKDLPWSLAEQAFSAIHEYGFRSVANILLGSPFLSPRKQVEDTIRSILILDALGIDEIFLFPANVKAGTLVGWLWEQGYYGAPSLWALFHVIATLPKDVANKLAFAWHRTYYHDSQAVQQKLRKTPDLEGAEEEVVKGRKLLDSFLIDRNQAEVIRFLEKAEGYVEWRRSLSDAPKLNVADVIAHLTRDVVSRDLSEDDQNLLEVYRTLQDIWW